VLLFQEVKRARPHIGNLRMGTAAVFGRAAGAAR